MTANPTNAPGAVGFPAECMACVVARQARALPDEWSEARRAEYLRAVMRTMLDGDPAESRVSGMRRLAALAGEWQIPKPDYGPVKRLWNQRMLALAPELRAAIDAAPDPLARAIQIARAANYIDYGALDTVEEAQLLALLAGAGDEPLDGAEYARFRRDLESARTLVYLTDNCGEIVADRLLVERLRAARPGLRATVIVRGLPTGNDATPEDARMAGMDAVAEVLGNGTGLTGTFLEAIDPAARGALESADVIIAKGQANFESLQGSGLNIYYLFLCKCGRFERRFGMKKLQGVLANERRLALEPEGRA